MKNLSVIIPCYNEEPNIPEIYKRLSAACKEFGDDYELVFVNDGSEDNSWYAITRLAEGDNHIVAVDLSRNFGHEIALTAGLSTALGEKVLIIDADLQDPPELLSPMMKMMNEGADVVYAVRKTRKGESFLKLFAARIFYRLLGTLTEVKIPFDTGDFRLMQRKVVEAFLAMPENPRFTRGMIAWTGFRQVSILYDRDERFAGKSKYNFRKLLHLALDAISGFSVKPLRLTFYMGIILVFLGMAMLGYVIWSWNAGVAVPGWSSLAVLLIFLQSCQFIFLGIIGEYIGRVFTEVKKRPLFFIREVKRGNGK